MSKTHLFSDLLLWTSIIILHIGFNGAGAGFLTGFAYFYILIFSVFCFGIGLVFLVASTKLNQLEDEVIDAITEPFKSRTESRGYRTYQIVSTCVEAIAIMSISGVFLSFGIIYFLGFVMLEWAGDNMLSHGKENGV